MATEDYRQWPVKQPSHNATFLHTQRGLTLWFHMAMRFGAAASVWNFNRVADALQRMLLLIVGGHYVDDFNGLEYAARPRRLPHVLGLPGERVKGTTAAATAVLQGVDVHIHQAGGTLSPTTRRVQKLRHAMSQALQDDSLTPREASRLAGKLVFLTQAVFGSVGRSAMQPLYARSHDTSTGDDYRLSDGLRSAMKAIRHMLSNNTPRFIPHVVDEQLHTAIFAEMFSTRSRHARPSSTPGRSSLN